MDFGNPFTFFSNTTVKQQQPRTLERSTPFESLHKTTYDSATNTTSPTDTPPPPFSPSPPLLLSPPPLKPKFRKHQRLRNINANVKTAITDALNDIIKQKKLKQKRRHLPTQSDPPTVRINSTDTLDANKLPSTPPQRSTCNDVEKITNDNQTTEETQTTQIIDQHQQPDVDASTTSVNEHKVCDNTEESVKTIERRTVDDDKIDRIVTNNFKRKYQSKRYKMMQLSRKIIRSIKYPLLSAVGYGAYVALLNMSDPVALASSILFTTLGVAM